jgi:hypothetical protein
MSNEDKPLPVSFWGEPAGLDQNPPLVTRELTKEEEIESWRASFLSLGITPEMAMMKYYGTRSTVLQHDMYTLEDVYKHLSMPAKTEQPTEAPTKSNKKREIHEANEKWREAIRLRAKAMAEWNEYVSACHAAYRSAKGS